MSAPVYILGGCQTDFARNWLKEGKDIVAMLQEAVSGGLTAAGIEAKEVDVAHIGNFAAELYCKQGQLGGFLAEIDPAFSGIPTSRHEAACASGIKLSIRTLASKPCRFVSPTTPTIVSQGSCDSARSLNLKRLPKLCGPPVIQYHRLLH